MDQEQSDSGYSAAAPPGGQPDGRERAQSDGPQPDGTGRIRPGSDRLRGRRAGGHPRAATGDQALAARRNQPGAAGATAASPGAASAGQADASGASGEQPGTATADQDGTALTDPGSAAAGSAGAARHGQPGAATAQQAASVGGDEQNGDQQSGDEQNGDQPNGKRQISTGRNLPAAIGVGVLLGGLVILTLFTVKVTFLVLVAVMVGIALWEFSRGLASRDIHLPIVPIIVGGAAMVALAYWHGERPAIVTVALTFAAILAWRLSGGPHHYLRDVSAGAVALLYLPTMAIFVALLLAEPDGNRRALIFVVLSVCSDTGGYFAGILAGRHLMAPTISPKKTWEGVAGSMLLCLVAGGIMLPELLNGHVWQGLLLGLAAVAAATLGDLVESMIKRDLQIKDMGSLLPGHGGIMDRIDSYLLLAPVVWLLLSLFVSNGHAT